MTRERVERFPIPDELPERFMGILYSMVEPFGIDKIPEAVHFIELLGLAVERHACVEARGSADKRLAVERKKFITIFKTRYLHKSDLEYSRPVTPAEAKNMGQVIDMLVKKGFEVDEFLEWVFDVFLEENTKFNPPTLKFACSQFLIDKFIYENRDKMKQRKADDLRKHEALDIVSRARALLREYKERNDKDGVERVTEMLSSYRDGRIMLEKLRADVQNEEDAVRVKQEATAEEAREA